MEMQQELFIENFQHAKLSNFFNLKIPLINNEYKFYGALSFSIFQHINDLHESQQQYKAEKLVDSLKMLFKSITNEINFECIEYYKNMLDSCAKGNLNLNDLRMNKEKLKLCGYCLFQVGLINFSPQFDMFFNIKKNKYHLEIFAKCLKVTIIIVYEEQNQYELLGCDNKTLILPIVINGSSISVLKRRNEFRGQKNFPILYMAKGNISSTLNCLRKFFKKNPTLEQKKLLCNKLNESKLYPEINLFLSQEIDDISDGLNNFICEDHQLKFIRTECKASHCLECLVKHLKIKFPRVLETCYNEDMACICMKKISLKDYREICHIYKSCCNKKKVSLSREMDAYLSVARNLQYELEREKEIQRNAEIEKNRKLEEERLRQIEEQRREIRQKIEDENRRKKQEEEEKKQEEEKKKQEEEKKKQEDEKKKQEIILRKKQEIIDQYEEEKKRSESAYLQKIAQDEEKKKLDLMELKKGRDEKLKTIDREFGSCKEKIIKSPHEYPEEFILLEADSPQFGQASPQSPIYLYPESKPKNANGCSDENYCSKMSLVHREPEVFFKPAFPARQISPPTKPKITFGTGSLTVKCDYCKKEKFKNDFSIHCNSENAHDVCNSCNSGRQNCIICNLLFTEDQLQILENYYNFRQQGSRTCEMCKRIISGFQQGVNRNICKECDESLILCCKCSKSLTQEKSFKCKHCSRSLHYTCNNSPNFCSICRNYLD